MSSSLSPPCDPEPSPGQGLPSIPPMDCQRAQKPTHSCCPRSATPTFCLAGCCPTNPSAAPHRPKAGWSRRRGDAGSQLSTPLRSLAMPDHAASALYLYAQINIPEAELKRQSQLLSEALRLLLPADPQRSAARTLFTAAVSLAQRGADGPNGSAQGGCQPPAPCRT